MQHKMHAAYRVLNPYQELYALFTCLQFVDMISRFAHILQDHLIDSVV